MLVNVLVSKRVWTNGITGTELTKLLSYWDDITDLYRQKRKLLHGCGKDRQLFDNL